MKHPWTLIIIGTVELGLISTMDLIAAMVIAAFLLCCIGMVALTTRHV